VPRRAVLIRTAREDSSSPIGRVRCAGCSAQSHAAFEIGRTGACEKALGIVRPVQRSPMTRSVRAIEQARFTLEELQARLAIPRRPRGVELRNSLCGRRSEPGDHGGELREVGCMPNSKDRIEAPAAVEMSRACSFSRSLGYQRRPQRIASPDK